MDLNTAEFCFVFDIGLVKEKYYYRDFCGLLKKCKWRGQDHPSPLQLMYPLIRALECKQDPAAPSTPFLHSILIEFDIICQRVNVFGWCMITLLLGPTRITVYSVMVRFSATTGYKIANRLLIPLENSHWLRHVSCVDAMRDRVKCPFMKQMSFHDNCANR